MKALITGASSGIGYEMAKELIRLGYDIYCVSRKEGDLVNLSEEEKSHIEFHSYDLTKESECFRLLDETKDLDLDIYINNSGFGDIGYITSTDINKEIDMIKLNDIALVILTKEYLKRFIKKDKGRVLVTASAAAFGCAPYMSCYYATKSFCYSLVHGYYRELKNMKSHVTISVLCPGPVKTRFEEKANTKFNVKPLSQEYVGKYAIKKMMKGKLEVVPGTSIKLLHAISHVVPKKLITKVLNKSASINK